MKKSKIALSVLLILLSMICAGCNGYWSYLFFFYDVMLNDWDFYSMTQGDRSYGCGPMGLVLDRYMAVPRLLFSGDFSLKIKFTSQCDASNVADYFALYLADDSVRDFEQLFMLRIDNIGDEENEGFLVLDDTIYSSPDLIAVGDYLPSGFVRNGENELMLERTGKNIRISLNGELFVEEDLINFDSDFFMPMLEVGIRKGSIYETFAIKRISIEYSGKRQKTFSSYSTNVDERLMTIQSLGADVGPEGQ